MIKSTLAGRILIVTFRSEKIPSLLLACHVGMKFSIQTDFFFQDPKSITFDKAFRIYFNWFHIVLP